MEGQPTARFLGAGAAAFEAAWPRDRVMAVAALLRSKVPTKLGLLAEAHDAHSHVERVEYVWGACAPVWRRCSAIECG